MELGGVAMMSSPLGFTPVLANVDLLCWDRMALLLASWPLFLVDEQIPGPCMLTCIPGPCKHYCTPTVPASASVCAALPRIHICPLVGHEKPIHL